jgi:TetR/AcrR family transcriptional repressor of nem operon
LIGRSIKLPAGRMTDSTRDRLIDAARSLFAEKGYTATSVAEILQRADANSGSLYYFFPTKQDLLLAVLERYQHGIEAMLLEPAWRGVADPIERIFALLGAYRRRLEATACTYGCPIGSLALELHEPDPPVRERLAANFDGWTAAVERCLTEAGTLPEPRTRHVHPDHDGGRRDARAHAQDARAVRCGRGPAPAASRLASGLWRAAP